MDLTIPQEKMYEALVNRDSEFDGLFYAGIKTTGIFCRSTCRARKPKRENVEFYKTAKEALEYGYRPCKICHPLTPRGSSPDWLKPLMTAVEKNYDLRFKDSDLRNLGFSPSRVRRWFKENHKMTFQAYLRLLRLGKAFKQIKNGDKVIESAYDSGYESLSGFSDSFKKNMGGSPIMSINNDIVIANRITTPLGPMIAGATDEGLCLLEFADRRMLETQLTRIRKYLKAEIITGKHKYIDMTEKQLGEYFDGKRKSFDLPLNLSGTDFQKQVWEILMTIPYGQTRSYAEQAKLINNPKAVRAVARANGDNKIAIIIPCHRVIGSNGKLVGYGGGLHRKEFLLDLEQSNIL